METTIKVSQETRARINKVKYSLECKTHDETINRVLDIVQKIQESEGYKVTI